MDLDLSRLTAYPNTPEEVVAYLREGMPALLQLATNLAQTFDVTNVAPAKPREGDLRYADGTNWNPGGGAGLYRYTSGAWVLQVPAAGWVAAPKLIQSQVVSSAVASLDFTTGITSAYDVYELSLAGIVPATDGALLWLRMQEGGSFKSGATDYNNVRLDSTNAAATPTGTIPDTKIVLGAVGNATGEHINATIRLFRPSLSTLYKQVRYDVGRIDAAEVYRLETSAGWYVGNTNPVTGLQILFSAGNISAGRATLYGIPHV